MLKESERWKSWVNEYELCHIIKEPCPMKRKTFSLP